ncbi:hypothetical protein [Amycolatopsis thermalba]|uniref:hypothetical protein n=1 Tax=Amycolatopsis thermalba TaxID=944492 RepID=UPI001ABF129A|nr:hypothetical protein [Amycolatopsis thermalba]
MFDALWRDLTGDAPGPVEFTGAHGVRPGPYRVAAAASMSVAAATLAAVVWRVCGRWVWCRCSIRRT